MSTWIDCPSCLGSGKVEQPSIKEKIARHLIYAAAHAGQTLGLMLNPDEAQELGRELGILEPAAPPPAAAEAEPAPAYPPISPELAAHLGIIPEQAQAPAEAAPAPAEHVEAPLPAPELAQAAPELHDAIQQWRPIDAPPEGPPTPPASLTGPPGGY